MPELPEVETIKRQLEKYLPLQVTSWEKSNVSGSIIKEESFDPAQLQITSINRKGKMLYFEFTNHHTMFSHLGMSGSWQISTDKINKKHTHVQFICKNQSRKLFLAYIDPRRFGNIYFVNSEKRDFHLNKLGVDISSSSFTTEVLINLFKNFPLKQLKPFLLEQQYLSGVGNYMASEICARAGIRPTRRLHKIKKNEYLKILNACQSVLDDTLKTNGTTFSGGYQDAFGEKGEGLKNLVVFYQTTCGLCKNEQVKKITLAGRGTYYCPKCQK